MSLQSSAKAAALPVDCSLLRCELQSAFFRSLGTPPVYERGYPKTRGNEGIQKRNDVFLGSTRSL